MQDPLYDHPVAGLMLRAIRLSPPILSGRRHFPFDFGRCFFVSHRLDSTRLDFGQLFKSPDAEAALMLAVLRISIEDCRSTFAHRARAGKSCSKTRKMDSGKKIAIGFLLENSCEVLGLHPRVSYVEGCCAGERQSVIIFGSQETEPVRDENITRMLAKGGPARNVSLERLLGGSDAALCGELWLLESRLTARDDFGEFRRVIPLDTVLLTGIYDAAGKVIF